MNLFEYSKRQDMKNHPLFQKINYSTSMEETGNLDYILRQAHENKVRENGQKSVVKLGEWEKYYFHSGEQRKELGDTYQTRMYYGRTEEELAAMASALREKLNGNGYNITLRAAENIIYITVIDNPCSEYMRCCNVVFKLQKQYPNMAFELSKPQEMKEYGVDIMVYKEKRLIGAIKTLPNTDFNKKEVLDGFKQMHETFKIIYGCGVQFAFSSVCGYMEGPAPIF